MNLLLTITNIIGVELKQSAAGDPGISSITVGLLSHPRSSNAYRLLPMKNLRTLGRAAMFVLGLAMVAPTIYWVISMLAHGVRGDDSGLAVFNLIVGAVLWIPTLIVGFLLMGGGRFLKATRKPKQIDCLACNQSMPSLALFCPHCGSEAHRAPNCRSCGAPRQANHRFCRDCGASAA